MQNEPPRNTTIDVARAFSVFVVVLFHGLIFQASVGPDGALQAELWAPPTWVWGLSWLLMSMPLFFACGGFANALIVDKMRRRGTGFSHYLANRGRRLTGGLTLFVTVFAVIATVAAWVGYPALAAELSRSLMFLLWFISVYLVIVLFAPLMVRLHDRFGAWVIVAMLLGIVVVDRAWIGFGRNDIGQINMFLVWPLCHQLGIGYQRGWFREGPARRTWALLLAAAVAIAVLIAFFGYPASAVGFANAPRANHLPPTLAMALLGVAQVAALGLVERSGAFARLSPQAEARLAKLSALMMTVYLWHGPCLLIGAAALLLAAMVLPLAAPVLLAQATVLGVGVVLILVLVPLIGLVEYRLIPPLGTSQDRYLALLSYVLMIAGAMLVWRHGTVLHPAYPGSALGVVAIWAGTWTMVRASRPVGVARSADDLLKPQRGLAARRAGESPLRAGNSPEVVAPGELAERIS
ncbi:acyltransferase family protein [Tessaracoccus sp. Y1736]